MLKLTTTCTQKIVCCKVFKPNFSCMFLHVYSQICKIIFNTSHISLNCSWGKIKTTDLLVVAPNCCYCAMLYRRDRHEEQLSMSFAWCFFHPLHIHCVHSIFLHNYFVAIWPHFVWAKLKLGPKKVCGPMEQGSNINNTKCIMYQPYGIFQ